jgi:hypothetical protein
MDPIKLWTIALVAQATVATNVMTLRFETPGAGSYQVARSCDLKRWEYVYTGHVHGSSSVAARFIVKPTCEFYVVNFIKQP